MSGVHLTENGKLWALSIGLIFLPLLWIHLSSDETIPRLTSIVLFFTLFPGIIAISVLNPNERPISNAPRLKSKYPKDVLKRWDLVFKLMGVVGVILMMHYITIPLLGGVYRYAVQRQPVELIEGTPTNPSTALFGQFWLVQSFDLADSGQHYQFWFPNVIRVEERHQFVVLPGTNLVLDSRRI